MKRVIIILTLTLLASCGTDQGEGKLYSYSVKNSSGKAIVIKSYLSGLPEKAPIITLLAIDELKTETFQDFSPPSGYSYNSFFGDGDTQRDSLVVIYDNQKKQIFVNPDACNGSDRNPLNYCVYNEIEENFIFTTDDFENAESCNGNCD